MTDPQKPPLRLSPTQIEVLERCERLWYFDRVLKLRERTSTKSQLLGMAVEEMIEARIFRGTEPPQTREGNIARAMLRLLPSSGGGLVSQQEFEIALMVDGQPVMLNGKKDLVKPGSRVWDFKTTKSLSKWQKTPAVLMKDIQAQTYALDEVVKHGMKEVPLMWVYGQTEGACRSADTFILMPADVARQGQARAEKAAGKMLRLYAEKPDAKEVSANTQACDMFGGCAHRAYCPARASKLSDFLPKEKAVGFADRLKAALTDEEKPVATKTVEATIGAADPGQPPTISKEMVKLPTENSEVAPPDALPSPDDQPKVEEPVAVEMKRPRGRPRKTEVAAAVEAIVQEVTRGSPNTPAVSTVLDAAKAGLLTLAPTILFVDGAAVKAKTTPLEPLLRKAAELAAQKGGVEDWRMVEYGKGAGLLLLAFAELWTASAPTGLLTINSRTPEAGPVLAWLIERVDTVVKGIS